MKRSKKFSLNLLTDHSIPGAYLFLEITFAYCVKEGMKGVIKRLRVREHDPSKSIKKRVNICKNYCIGDASMGDEGGG